MTRPRFTYDFPRPMVTVDAVVFRRGPQGPEFLAISRRNEPFANCYALPGGFVEMDEDLLDAALRELFEEAGLKGVSLQQLGAFGKPGRDPRGRTISVAFVGLLRDSHAAVQGGDDAEEATWLSARRPPELAFDHLEILREGLRWLQEHEAAEQAP